MRDAGRVDKWIAGWAALVDLLAPEACGGCGTSGTSWCVACAGTVGAPRRVGRGSGTHGPGASAAAPLASAVFAAGRYRGPLRTALLAYKERGRRDLATPLARLLTVPLAAARAALPVPVRSPRGAPLRLVPAPSRPAAAHGRGGDHVLRLCRLLAARDPTLQVVAALRLARRTRDSVGLDATQRRANLAGRLRLCAARLPPPCAQVVLVDDVVTSGATLAACTAVLAERGVRVAAAVVLCDATTGSLYR